MSITNILVSAITSACVTLFLFLFQPWLKKAWTTRRLKMIPAGMHGRHINLRVINESAHTVTQAALYITIIHTTEDLFDPPADNIELFHNRHAPYPINECPLCWSSRNPAAVTPPKVDIYSKESQSFSPFYIHPNSIEVPSEAGWLHDKKKGDTPSGSPVRISRANLALKKYVGVFKIVSAETIGKEYHFELDPANQQEPIRIWPVKKSFFFN